MRLRQRETRFGFGARLPGVLLENKATQKDPEPTDPGAEGKGGMCSHLSSTQVLESREPWGPALHRLSQMSALSTRQLCRGAEVEPRQQGTQGAQMPRPKRWAPSLSEEVPHHPPMLPSPTRDLTDPTSMVPTKAGHSQEPQTLFQLERNELKPARVRRAVEGRAPVREA